MRPQIASGYLEIGRFEAQLLVFHKGVNKASDSAEELRKHRCACRTCDTPAESLDEKHVEGDVHNRRNQEEHQRRERIADAAQYAYDEVVEQLRHNAEEYDETVGVSGVEHFGVLLGYVDPRKHRLYAEHGNKRQNHRHNAAEYKLRRKGFAHTVRIVRADFVGYHHAKTCGATERKLHKYENQRCGVVDSCDLVCRKRLTANRGVREYIELLQQVGNDYRH